MVSTVLNDPPPERSCSIRPVHDTASGSHGPAEKPLPAGSEHFGPLETVNSTGPPEAAAGGETFPPVIVDTAVSVRSRRPVASEKSSSSVRRPQPHAGHSEMKVLARAAV